MGFKLPPLCRECSNIFLALSHDTTRSLCLSPDIPQARSRLSDLAQVLVLMLYLSLRAESNARRGGKGHTDTQVKTHHRTTGATKISSRCNAYSHP